MLYTKSETPYYAEDYHDIVRFFKGVNLRAMATFWKYFPEFVFSEKDLQIAGKAATLLADCGGGYLPLHEAAEQLILLPDWNSVFGSYIEALRVFHDRAEGPGRKGWLVDLFSGLLPETINRITRHSSVQNRLIGNPIIPKVGKFFVVGVNFRLWRRGETGEAVLRDLFPTEVPSGLLDCFYLNHFSHARIPGRAFWHGVGAVGDLLDSDGDIKGPLGGSYLERGGQLSEDVFRFAPLKKKEKSYVSLFVPDMNEGSFFDPPRSEGRNRAAKRPETWDEAVELARAGKL